MSILAGRWAGQISGTNVGSFILELEVSGDILQGNLALHDLNHGAFSYDVSGEADKNRVTLALTPRIFPPDSRVDTVEAEGLIQPDGGLSGEWRSPIGTHGSFLCFKQSPVAPNAQPSPPPISISYRKQRGVVPCAVDSEILRRVFSDLSSGADEAARLEIARQAPINELGVLPLHRPQHKHADSTRYS